MWRPVEIRILSINIIQTSNTPFLSAVFWACNPHKANNTRRMRSAGLCRWGLRTSAENRGWLPSGNQAWLLMARWKPKLSLVILPLNTSNIIKHSIYGDFAYSCESSTVFLREFPRRIARAVPASTRKSAPKSSQQLGRVKNWRRPAARSAVRVFAKTSESLGAVGKG